MARAVGVMPCRCASCAYAATASLTFGFGPYRDSASAYRPLYLFRRAVGGPPSAAWYLLCGSDRVLGLNAPQHNQCAPTANKTAARGR
jgi:hypothetical protein